MISTSNSVIFSLLISLFASYLPAQDISFDYPSRPYHPFDIEHADIRLDLENDQHLVNGTVIYALRSKIDGLTELYLNAGELSLDNVSIGGEEAEYQVSGDSLIIQLSDTLSRGDGLELSLSWQTISNYGLHRSSDGAFWSSMNPMAHRHWLPGFDHPREEFTFDASITIPNEMEVMFNGDLGEVSIASAEKKRVEWSSETSVPATGLGFITGHFNISEMTAGFTKLRLFHSNSMQNQAADLVVEAARLKKEIEDKLSFEYPWDALNIVVTSDNYWMERTHGAGTIYLFERLGDLENQLARNMYLQWFGEYQRKEQYFGVNGLIPTSLHYQIHDTSALIENPDSLWMIDDWNNWQLGYQHETSILRSTVEAELQDLMRQFSGVVHADEYAELWYQETGISFFELSPKSIEKGNTESNSATSYVLNIELDEAASKLKFYFELKDGSGDELYSMVVNEHQFDVITNQEISFTGEKDTVTITVPVATEFITLDSSNLSIEHVEIGKSPLFYLLNQLRSQEASDRQSAAKLLVQHSENPDLQLALSDILAFEEDSEVIAAIYESLAVLTNGASGTEEQFIAGLSNESEAIQLASIRALINYPENEYVRSSLRSKLVRSEGVIFETALNAYNRMASGKEMLGLVQSIQQRDTVGFKTLRVLEVADSLHQNEEALQIAADFLNVNVRFPVRKLALEYLNKFDIDPERWNQRFDELIGDRDPRIRFWVVEHSTRFKSASEALIFLTSAGINEWDPRVLLMAEAARENLSE